MRLHYVSTGSRRVHTEVFAYGLADDRWHAVSITLSGTQVRLFVDCRLVYTRTLAAGPADTSFTDSPNLYVGQRNKGVHSIFKVYNLFFLFLFFFLFQYYGPFRSNTVHRCSFQTYSGVIVHFLEGMTSYDAAM